MAERSPLVLEARDLRKSYPGVETIHVLRGVELELRAGEFVSVMGQSGSGKSTLLNLLAGLDRPTSGIVRIDGRDLATMDDEELAVFRSHFVGLVFQFHYLLDEYTCLENALLPLMIRPRGPSRADVARVRGLLEQVGLGDRLHLRPPQLSGGQQQRTAIVRALANQPWVLFADEPTGNLDSRTGGEVFRLFREMNRTQGVSVVMVTHDDRLARAADRMLRIEDGVMEAVDLTDSYMERFRSFRRGRE